MVKEGHLAAAIVALQTAVAVCQPVFFHVNRIFIGVAGHAVQGCVYKAVLPVAGLAVKRLSIKILLVIIQAEAGQRRMIDICKCKFGDVRRAPLVFDMAVLAAVGARKPAVQPFDFGALSGDLDVAVLAAVVFDAVHRRVAVGTLLLKFGMRGETLHILAVQLY
jgi:hypothetical protein